MSAMRTDEAHREPPSHYTHQRGCRGCWASWSLALLPGPSPCTLTPEPARVPSPGRPHGGNASSISFSLPRDCPPPDASSEATIVVQAQSTPGGRASCRGCDSGLSQAEAGCQRHSLGHSSIYRQHNCWPSLVGGSGRCCRWQVRGMGASSEPG